MFALLVAMNMLGCAVGHKFRYDRVGELRPGLTYEKEAVTILDAEPTHRQTHLVHGDPPTYKQGDYFLRVGGGGCWSVRSVGTQGGSAYVRQQRRTERGGSSGGVAPIVKCEMRRWIRKGDVGGACANWRQRGGNRPGP